MRDVVACLMVSTALITRVACSRRCDVRVKLLLLQDMTIANATVEGTAKKPRSNLSASGGALDDEGRVF